MLANTSVEAVDIKGNDLKVKIKDRKSGKEEIIECDVVLSAAGISTNIEGIGLEEVGIKSDKGLNNS